MLGAPPCRRVPTTMASRDSVSKRSLPLMKGPLSYIGAFFRASAEGLWCAQGGAHWITARGSPNPHPCREPSRPEGWIPLLVSACSLHAPQGCCAGWRGAPDHTAAAARLPPRGVPPPTTIAEHPPWQVAENKLNNAAVLERLEGVQKYPLSVMNYSGCAGRGAGGAWASRRRSAARARVRRHRPPCCLPRPDLLCTPAHARAG